MTTSRTHRNGQHTGYVVSNDHDAVVATVDQSREPDGGYFVRLYTGPDECSIKRRQNMIDARDLAERHAMRMS